MQTTSQSHSFKKIFQPNFVPFFIYPILHRIIVVVVVVVVEDKALVRHVISRNPALSQRFGEGGISSK